MNQKGGLKLKDPTKTGFKAVYDMINSSSCVLKLMTYQSLKGFIITLDVDPSDSEYLNVDMNGRFTDPVTSFLFKIAVITPRNDTELEPFVGPKGTRNKSSESADSYFEEAKLQNTIWKKSIAGGRPEICPPIANFSLFDNNNSKKLLEFLYSKSNNDDTRAVFQYLIKVNNTVKNGKRNNSIGVIIMPKVQSMTLDRITQMNIHQQGSDEGKPLDEISKEKLDNAYACVTAQTVRLFIDIGVIHFDLHDDNSLISNSNCVLIDFGRASFTLSEEDDDYFNVGEKEEMKQKKEEFYNKFFEISQATGASIPTSVVSVSRGSTSSISSLSSNSSLGTVSSVSSTGSTGSTGSTSSDSTGTRSTRSTRSMVCKDIPPPKCKSDFIMDVMKFLAKKDLDKNQAMFSYSKPTQYQMMWFEYYKNDPNSLIPVKAFDILQNSIPAKSKGMTPSTIRAYEKQGIFMDFNLPLDNFVVPFPGPDVAPQPSIAQQPPCEGWGCTVSGGRARRKRTKKQLRKYRKSRKHRQKSKSRTKH